MDTVPAISLQLLTENSLLPSSAPSERALEVRLTAPPSPSTGQRLALNLSLVLDRSGSMQGAKLEYVKQAAAHVLNLLEASDRISLVAYDDGVTIVSESAFLTPQVKQEIIHSLKAIRTGASTNLYGGWLAGCQQVAQHQANEGGQVDRTLLLTDGLANVGITDPEELAVYARELAARGVSTSTFGVGEGFNEELLELMATNGGGNFTYIVSPVDIPDIFAREFRELKSIAAREVEVDLDIPSGVEITPLGEWHLEKASQETGQEKLRISLGSLCGSQEQNLYFRLGFSPCPEGEKKNLKVTVRGRSESGEILESRGELTFTFAGAQEVEAATVDQGVLERFTLARLSDTSRQALKKERAGSPQQASAMLQQDINHSRGILGDSQLRKYEKMAQKMKHGLSEADRKGAHYDRYLYQHQREDALFAARTENGDLDSTTLLRQLLRDQVVRVHEDDLLWKAPAALPHSFSFDRVEGMLLGLAIGDSLGNTTESLTPAQRQTQRGEITGYLPNRHAGNQAVGLPSDDTQMAFWTVEVLSQEGSLNPDHLARRFTQEEIFGIGSTVKAFIRDYKDRRLGWLRSGQESAGNGALMRIAPILLPHLRQPSPGLWADAVLAGMITHNDYASNAACCAFMGMLWELLGMRAAPRQDWWAEAYYRIAAPLEGQTSYESKMDQVNYRDPLSQFVRQEVGRALKSGWTTVQAGNTWGSGAYLMETLPTALYILAVYGDDPEQAIVRAVNDTWDNDTIAAIVGAAVGALHGKDALPKRWISSLLGRTNAHNDGHVFRLIEQAKKRFG